ncbi:hypothetical protein [Pontibacter mangrovi]|uniref:Uncharacterized protein n=1 Tax=Pontibacter mangrovi TaxID=2589816 RepID=A0A501WH62_9BACT|nr:hypothetical protein [Pontibacter mangrovi]TPE44936.1 hypothetical protein FJM65_07940 [Pontibacter mangrovi]
MAQILLKSYWFLENAGTPSFPSYYYVQRLYEFNTETRTVAVRDDTNSPQPSDPTNEGYSRPTNQAFFSECLPETYTKRSYYHDGNGGFVSNDTLNSSDCGYVPAEPVYGCTNPEASNYDPTATVDNGSCILPERLTVDALPDLAVVGNPITATLHAAATGQEPKKAEAVLTLGAVGYATQLTVDGQLFTFSLAPQMGQFYDADTLAQAFFDNEYVSSRYTIGQPGEGQVKLTAIKEGSAFTPSITVNEETITVAITAGVDALRSQTKKAWGCYLEVWGCAGSYGTPVGKEGAELLERSELLYAPGNSYAFDVASVLRLHTGHALFSEADRLKPYFLRYGEVYSSDGLALRRRYPVGESPVLWALEGALPLYALNDLAAPRLLNRQTLAQAPLHGGAYAEALYVLAATGAELTLEASFRYYDGSVVEEVVSSVATVGGVQRLALQAVFTRAYALSATKKVTGCTVTVKIAMGAAATVLGSLPYHFPPATGRERCLVFLTSLSAYETVWVQGYTEPAMRRSPQLYRSGVPFNATTSSRNSRVQRVELSPSERLHTGLLTRESFDFLLAELAPSPEVYLYENGTYTACQLTDMDPAADVLAEEYSLSLTLEPGLTHNPISN